MKTKNKIIIKRLEEEDISFTQELILLFQNIFEMENPTLSKASYLKNILSSSHLFAYVAIHENKIIGGLTAHELPMLYYQQSEMFIYDIAVESKFQRKGVGKRLLSALKDYCAEKGINEIFVAANVEDAHALDFYRSAKGKPENVVHFTFHMK